MQPESGPARIDVVVPVHGGWSHVRECLESLDRQTVPVRVVVVDDRSPDDTLTRIREAFPHLTVLANEENLGFSASCNRGIREGSAPFVVLLNSDVVADPDLARRILEAFDTGGDEVGSVAPILQTAEGTVDSFGVSADVTGAGYVRFHGAPLDRVNPDRPSLLGPYGAAAGYRRDALDQVGLLDERIFMYGEELELAFRLRAGGWRAIDVPAVVGTHIGGASAGKASTRQLYLSGFGRGYFLRVYGVLRSRHALRALISESVVVFVWTLGRRDLTAWRGRWDGWRAGRGVPRRPIAHDAPDRRIGFWRSMRMRRAGYWTSTP